MYFRQYVSLKVWKYQWSNKKLNEDDNNTSKRRNSKRQVTVPAPTSIKIVKIKQHKQYNKNSES